MNQYGVFDMEEQKAKWVFDQGGFSKALVVPTPMGAGYHLHLVQFGRQAETSVLERQRGGWRVFKTIDAAVSTAKTIGFHSLGPVGGVGKGPWVWAIPVVRAVGGLSFGPAHPCP